MEAKYPEYDVDLLTSEKIACNVTAAPITGYTDEEHLILSHLLYIERITYFPHSCFEADEIRDPDFKTIEILLQRMFLVAMDGRIPDIFQGISQNSSALTARKRYALTKCFLIHDDIAKEISKVYTFQLSTDTTSESRITNKPKKLL